MHQQKQTLIEPSRIGPYLDKVIVGWLNDNPEVEDKMFQLLRQSPTFGRYESWGHSFRPPSAQ